MKCDRVRELVSDALDGTLEGSVREAFHEHLEQCPPCRVLHAEMQQSLALLEELPVVEVTEKFDEAVWRRIRALEEPRSVRDLLRRRWADVWSRVEAWPGLARWSPAAVAVAVLLMLRIAPQPAPVVRPGGMAPSEVASPGSAELARVSDADIVDVPIEASEVTPEEVYAEMPEAIEAYLENARDLRLQADPDRYRRSNWSYPLRHVRTPHLGQSVSATPVPVSTTPSDPVVTVVSF